MGPQAVLRKHSLILGVVLQLGASLIQAMPANSSTSLLVATVARGSEGLDQTSEEGTKNLLQTQTDRFLAESLQQQQSKDPSKEIEKQSLYGVTELHLLPGEIKNLDQFKDSPNSRINRSRQRIWIEKSKVLEVDLKTNSLKAKKPGVSLIRINDWSLTVHVLTSEQTQLYQLAQSKSFQLGQSKNFQLSKKKSQDEQHPLFELPAITLEQGRLVFVLNNHPLPEFWRPLFGFCKKNSCDYQIVNAGPEDLLFWQNEWDFPWPLHLAENGEIMAHCPLATGAEKEISWAKAAGVAIQCPRGSQNQRPLVELQLQLSELRKSSSRKLGLAWPSTQSVQITPQFLVSEQEILGSLQALEDSGEAKTLASPKLLIRDGAETEFHAGGEIPFRIVKFREQDVIWKKYGILVRAGVSVDQRKNINLKLIVEVSQPNFAQYLDGLPSLQTTRLQIDLDVRNQQQVILSGLVHKIDGEHVSGLPWLSRLPLLGALFSSRDFQQSESELILIAKPLVTDPNSTGNLVRQPTQEQLSPSLKSSNFNRSKTGT